jgi:hypothetical protein
MKILHVANFSESKFGQVFYSIDRKITNGLIRNGHFVYDFSYREVARNESFFKRKKAGSIKMNERLLITLENLMPDLLLLGHSELLEVNTLKKIKELYPKIKIAMWWVDPFDNISHINDRLPYLNAFFATTSPKFYKNKFINKTNFYFMPNICDDSIETSKSFQNSSYNMDLVFLGRLDDKRKNFIEKLKGLENINFKIFGNSKNTLIFGQNFLDTIASSKMTVNYSRYNSIPLYSSDRIIQLLAQGTLVFCPKIPDFENLFTNEEVVFFDDFEDLKEKIYFYNSHDEERIKISKNGWNRAHKSYNSTKVTAEMIELIFKDKKNDKKN